MTVPTRARARPISLDGEWRSADVQQSGRMKIGELAARAGVSVRALRYYEDRGLLRSDRTPAGQREYDDSALDRVRFIRTLFSAGLASRTIVSILPCIESGRLNADQRDLLLDEVGTLESRIADLAQARDRLAALIAVAPTSDRAGRLTSATSGPSPSE